MPIQFGDLPSSSGGRTADAWREEAAELREHPGKWAVIGTRKTTQAASQIVTAIRRGQLVAFRPAGSYEAAARGVDVWARYVGEVTPDA